MVTTKYHSRISDVSNYSSIKFHVCISSTDGNIRDWLLLNSRHTIYCSSRFAKLLKKTTFSGFLSFFSRKIVQISIFKVEYLENGSAIFNDFGLILQDFELPFR